MQRSGNVKYYSASKCVNLFSIYLTNAIVEQRLYARIGVKMKKKRSGIYKQILQTVVQKRIYLL